MCATVLIAAALAGGLVSSAAVCAVLLATGALDDDGGGGRAASAPASARAAGAPATPLALSDLYRRAARGVVRVDARPPGVPLPRGRPRRDDGVATGTGFVVNNRGSIVTNEHVVAGGSRVSVLPRDGAGGSAHGWSGAT